MDPLSSDHLPITISMTHAADLGSSAPATRFKYESADFSAGVIDFGSVWKKEKKKKKKKKR